MNVRIAKYRSWEKFVSLIALILVSTAVSFAANYYVSPMGDDSNSGSLSSPFETIQKGVDSSTPGDVVHLRSGTYRNLGFGSGDTNPPVVSLSASHSGNPGSYIVLRNYDGESPLIEFDGGGGIIANGGVSYFRIQGLTIKGPNSSIDLTTARSHAVRCSTARIPRYNGRGIAFWANTGSGQRNHHIDIVDTVVYDAPGSGIRVNGGDYLTIEDNTVYNCTWYTPSAESALTIADARSFDTNNGDKIIIRRNYVYNNYNRVPFFKGNANVPGNGDPNYGLCSSEEIVDGQGIYVTRSTNYTHGWTVIENNIAIRNGMNGITFHKSNRGLVVNNTVYLNGYSKVLDPAMATINWSGITINNAATAKVENNIIWGRGNNGLRQICDSPGCSNITISNNLYYNCDSSTLQGSNPFWNLDPLFVGGTGANEFDLQTNSPAIGTGLLANAPSDDFLGNARPGADSLVCIGAFEKEGSVSSFPSVFHLENLGHGKFLKSVSNEAELAPTSHTGSYTQWSRTTGGSGYFYLENQATSRRLKGESGSLPLETSGSDDLFLWRFESVSGDVYRLVNKYHEDNNTGTPNAWADSSDACRLNAGTGSWAQWEVVDAN